MLKKLLFIIASLMVGLLVVMFVSNKVSANVLNDLINDSIEKNEYTTLERFYTYATSKDEDKLYSGQKNNEGIYLEVFSSLNIRLHYVKDGDQVSVKYRTLDECMQIAIFKYDSNFKVKDEEGKRGHVDVVLSNDQTYTITFDNRKDDVTAVDYYNNYYDYATNYHFLFVPIYYSDIQAKYDTVDFGIKSVKVYDGSETLKYENTFDTVLTLNNNFHKALNEIKDTDGKLLVNYINDYNTKVAAGDNLGDSVSKIQSLINGSDKIYGQHTNKIITRQTKFIVWLVVTIVLFIVADGFLGYFLFKKKQSPRVVRNNTQRPTNIRPSDQPLKFKYNDKREIIDEVKEPKTENQEEKKEEE